LVPTSFDDDKQEWKVWNVTFPGPGSIMGRLFGLGNILPRVGEVVLGHSTVGEQLEWSSKQVRDSWASLLSPFVVMPAIATTGYDPRTGREWVKPTDPWVKPNTGGVESILGSGTQAGGRLKGLVSSLPGISMNMRANREAAADNSDSWWEFLKSLTVGSYIREVKPFRNAMQGLLTDVAKGRAAGTEDRLGVRRQVTDLLSQTMLDQAAATDDPASIAGLWGMMYQTANGKTQEGAQLQALIAESVRTSAEQNKAFEEMSFVLRTLQAGKGLDDYALPQIVERVERRHQMLPGTEKRQEWVKAMFKKMSEIANKPEPVRSPQSAKTP
jgi:hypothetical protein